MPDKLCTIPEAAQLIHKSERWLRELLANKVIPSKRMNRRRYIYGSALRSYIVEKRRVQAQMAVLTETLKHLDGILESEGSSNGNPKEF